MSSSLHLLHAEEAAGGIGDTTGRSTVMALTVVVSVYLHEHTRYQNNHTVGASAVDGSKAESGVCVCIRFARIE